MAKPKAMTGRPRKLAGALHAYALRLPADLYGAARRIAVEETRRAKTTDERAPVVSVNDVITDALRSWVRHRHDGR
jgi:hypothetical protein